MKFDAKIVVTAMMIVIIFLTLFYGKDVIGLDSDIDVSFAGLIPGLLIITVGFIGAATTRGVYLLPSLSIVGIGFAILSEELYDLGFVTSTMLEGLTIGQVQLYCIVMGLLFGGVLAFMGSRD